MVDLVKLGFSVDTRELEKVKPLNDNIIASSKKVVGAVNEVGESFDHAAAKMRQYEAIAQRTGEKAEQVKKRMESANSRRVGVWAGNSGGGGGGGNNPDDPNKPPNMREWERFGAIIGDLAERQEIARMKQRGLNREVAIWQAISKSGFAPGSDQANEIGRMAGELHDLEASMNRTNDSATRLASTLSRRLLMVAGGMAIRQSFQWLWDLNSQLATTQKTIETIGANGRAFQGLQSAFRIGGVDDNSFNQMMLSLTEEIGKAKLGLSDLGKLMKSNNMTLGSTEDTLLSIATLIQRSEGDWQKQASILKTAGLPATREMVSVLVKGREELQKTMDAHRGIADEAMKAAKAMDERFKSLWENFTMYAKAAAVTAFSGDYWSRLLNPQTYIDARNKMNANANRRANPMTAGTPDLGGTEGFGSGRVAGSTTKTAREIANDFATQKAMAEKNIQTEQTRLSLMKEISTMSDELRGKQLEFNRAAVEGNGISLTNQEKVLNAMRVQLQGAELQIRAANGIVSSQELMIQKQKELTIEVERGRMTQHEANVALENYARHAKDAADAAAVYASKLPGVTRMGQEFTDLRGQIDQTAVSISGELTQSLTDMTMNLNKGSEVWKNFGETVRRMLTEMIIKLAIVGPLMQALGGMFGGGMGGGYMMGGTRVPLLHGGGRPGRDSTGFREVSPLLIAGFPRFHGGKLPWGPDEQPAILHRSEAVVTQRDMMSGGGGVGDIAVHIHGAPQGSSATASASRDNNGMRIDIELQRQIESIGVASVQGGRMKDAIAQTFKLSKANNLT
jgi:hypothetical protein